MLLANGTTELADLTTLTENIHREINGQFTLKYSCLYQELKTEYLKTAQSVADNQTFDNVYVSQSNTVDSVFQVEAWHVFYRLKEDIVSTYAETGTVKEILEDIVSGTDFTIGTVDLTSTHTLTLNEETTKAQLILNFLGSLNLEIDFSNLGFTIDALSTVGANNGYTIEYGKNSLGITEHYDKRSGTAVTSYTAKILELKHSKEYLDNGYDVLEVIEIGDTIQVKHGDIETTQRIFSVDYNPKQRMNTNLELVQTLDLMTDSITNIKHDTISKTKNYYGITINSDDGFTCERSDQLAKSVFNADLFAMYSGDGLGGYTPSVFFDAITQKYKFIGDIDATGTITAGIFTGGTLTGGIINGATINGTTINGGIYYNTLGDTYMDMGVTQKIKFANATDDSGLMLDVQSGVNMSHIDTSNNQYNFISSAGGYTNANNFWIFTLKPYYNALPLATESYVTSRGYITGTSGYSGSFTNGDGNTVNVSNGLITSIS